MASHVLGVRAWTWFAVAFLAWSVAQFLSFHQLRQERDDMLAATATERVSLYRSRRAGDSLPVRSSRLVRTSSMRCGRCWASSALRGSPKSTRARSTRCSSGSSVRASSSPTEPLGAYDCQDGLAHLVETGELVDQPEDRGFSYRLSSAAAPG